VVLKSAHQRINGAAVYLSNEGSAAGICVYTHSGKTARHIAGLRPQNAPIFAFTPSIEVCRELSLHFGVVAHVIEPCSDANEILTTMCGRLIEDNHVQPGDSIVIVTDLVVGKETLHAIHVHVIK
jgi:pyruvate kinase